MQIFFFKREMSIVNMKFFKTCNFFQLVLSCLVILAFSAQIQVPAGIDPAACPGYPNCPHFLLTNNQPANQPANTIYELCPGKLQLADF